MSRQESRLLSSLETIVGLLVLAMIIGFMGGFIYPYVILGIILIIILYYMIIHKLCKNKLKKKYNITNFPKHTLVRRTSEPNSFDFVFPYWINKIVNNIVVTDFKRSRFEFSKNESTLYIEGYKMIFGNVIELFNYINELKSHGVKFEPHYLETIKFDNYINCDFDRIINTFDKNEDTNRSEFLSFIADIFIENGLETVKMGREIVYDCDLFYLTKDNKIGAIKCDLVQKNDEPNAYMLSKFYDDAKREGAQEKIYISTSKFKKNSKDYALDHGIKLIDRDELHEMFNIACNKVITKDLEFKDIRKYIPEDIIEILQEDIDKRNRKEK